MCTRRRTPTTVASKWIEGVPADSARSLAILKVSRTVRTGVKNFIERKGVDAHGRNYTKFVNLATWRKPISSLKPVSCSSTSERRNRHGKSCPVSTLASQTAALNTGVNSPDQAQRNPSYADRTKENLQQVLSLTT